MRVLEYIRPIGPWLTEPCVARIECTVAEAASLPGLVSHHESRWAGEGMVATLTSGDDPVMANAIEAVVQQLREPA